MNKCIFIKLILIFLILLNFNFSYASEIIYNQSQAVGVDTYVNKINTYVDTELEMDFNQFFKDLTKGNVSGVKQNIFEKILSVFGKELKENISLIIKILIVVLISSIINNLSNSFGKSQVTNIGFFISYLTIIILIMTNFNNILLIVTNALERLNSFMYSTVPIIFSLILSTGNIVTANVFQPILLFTIGVVNVLINKVIIPVILIYTVLNIVSNISEKEQLNKLAGFIKSLTIWTLVLSLTIIVGIMSLEGTLSSSVDVIAGKTTKAAISNFIPVVGKILGDAVETVLGCTIVLKNAVGFIGVLIVILICITPIIKVAVLMGLYYLTSAIIEPIADKRIIKCISYVGDSLKLVLAIMVSITFMYIISITLIIKISNFGISI